MHQALIQIQVVKAGLALGLGHLELFDAPGGTGRRRPILPVQPLGRRLLAAAPPPLATATSAAALLFTFFGRLRGFVGYCRLFSQNSILY